MTDMKQIIQTISLIILLGACTDEKYADAPLSKRGEPGEPVPVELSLNIQPMQSPLSSGTKAGGNLVSSTQVCKGLEIALVETPVTRALEDEITNYMIFQFGGTESTSELIWKKFINGNSVKDATLRNTDPQTARDRIIVIANAEEATFSSMQVSQSTLADFNNLGISYSGGSFPTNFPLFNPTGSGAGTDPRIIFVGSTDMTVSSGKQADIFLNRSVARVTVNLSLSQDMADKGYTWSYQFMNIPKKSFYHSIGRTAAFPGGTVGYDNYNMQNITTFPQNINNVYFPVNINQQVPFTTPEKRAANAPANATYLQLMGVKMAGGLISQSAIYHIHLGSNFTDDYSISPNYSYTYNIRITGESDDDSRVVKFIPGYFGGDLKMYTESGGVTTNLSRASTWRYEKRIEVSLNDVNPAGGVKWQDGSTTMPNLNDFMDGRQNTWNLRAVTAYSAIQRCIALNGATPGAIEDMVWYMPSYGQSLGIYVAGSSTLKSLPDNIYWTSTANNTYAWGMKIWSGESTIRGSDDAYNLRCVRDLIPGNSAQ